MIKEIAYMDVHSDLPKISKSQLDIKKYRKTIRKRFMKYNNLCKFHKFKDNQSKYKDSSAGCMDILFSDLNRPIIYDCGNIYFLISLITTHLEFLTEISDRILNTKDEIIIGELQNVILEKNFKLLDALKSNSNNPVTSAQMAEYSDGGLTDNA